MGICKSWMYQSNHTLQIALSYPLFGPIYTCDFIARLASCQSHPLQLTFILGLGSMLSTCALLLNPDLNPNPDLDLPTFEGYRLTNRTVGNIYGFSHHDLWYLLYIRYNSCLYHILLYLFIIFVQRDYTRIRHQLRDFIYIS